MTDWIETTDIQNMSDTEFLRRFRSPYWHAPGVKARLDQKALGTGYGPNPAGGEAARIAQERDRRGLVWPDSWEAAGLAPFK